MSSTMYRSGGPQPDRKCDEPIVLADVLVAAASKNPTGTFTIYTSPGEATSTSYAVLLDGARRIAAGLLREGLGRTSEKCEPQPALLAPCLPRAQVLVAFWGCVLAGVVPCLHPRKDRHTGSDVDLATAWDKLGKPVVLSNTGEDGSPEQARVLTLNALLAQAAPEETPPIVRSCYGEVVFRVTSIEAGREYHFSNAAVLANAASERNLISNGNGAKGACDAMAAPTYLNWEPLTQPSAILRHCACVCNCAHEVHADTLGLPRSTLRLLSRHRISQLVAPAAFFRRAASEFANPRTLTELALDLRCVRSWVVQDGGLGQDELSEFLRLINGEGTVAFNAFVAPWGAILATIDDKVANASGGLSFDQLRPVIGLELRSTLAEVTQVRGLAAWPGRVASAPHPRGWVCVRLGLPGEETCEEIEVAGGLMYSASEVEAAVEGAPGVVPGCTTATSSHDGGFAVCFAAAVPSASTFASTALAVRHHLAVSLGIRPKVLLPLPSCDVPRDGSGRPDRVAGRRLLLAAIENGDFEETSKDELEVLPNNWVFEEDFVPSTLIEEGDDEVEDEDEVEERMEGAAKIDIPVADGVGGISGKIHTIVLVGEQDTLGYGSAVARSLQEKHGQQCVSIHNWINHGETDVFATIRASGEVLDRVVVCAACDAISSAADGSDEPASFVALLQAIATARGSRGFAGLSVLWLSVGRHVRVAGSGADARKSLMVGALLSAAAECPGLAATHIDAASGVEPGSVGIAVVAELSAAANSSRGATEVLIDAEGRRLIRRLRSATLLPTPSNGSPVPRKRLRTALLVGGAGGVGLAWAKHLDASAIALVGRSNPSSPKVQQAFATLSASGVDMHYLKADVTNHAQLKDVVGSCLPCHQIDLAANLSEAFAPPMALLELGRGAFAGPAAKVQGAKNLLQVLQELRKARPKTGGDIPVIFTSSVVGVLGAARLAPYSAGVRGLEAVCASARQSEVGLDPRCVALSAWQDVGITTHYPALSAAAPAAGFHVMSPRCGVLALEAVLRRFVVPRFGVVYAGIAGTHPRFKGLVASGGLEEGSSSAVSTATLPGCIELVQAATKKIIRVDLKIGDNLIDAGVDSMSSLSLHAAIVTMSGGLELPPGMFYEFPTVLELATFVHKKAAEASGEKPGEQGESMDDALEAMLEDDDARRSYHLAQARDAMRRGDCKEASERASRAKQGAGGISLAAALAVEADAAMMMGNVASAGCAHRSALEAREAVAGSLHPDTSVAIWRLYAWAALASPDEAPVLRERLRHAHAQFVRSVTWRSTPWSLPTIHQAVPPAGPVGARLLQVRRLNLDGQNLAGVDISGLGALKSLESLQLRRTGLDVVPSEFACMTEIRDLLLTGNRLTDLPMSLSSLTRLHVLALEGNKFPRIPEVVLKFKRLLQLSFDEQQCALSGVAGLVLPASVLSVLRARGCNAEFPALVPPVTGPSNLNTVFWANNALTKVPDLSQFSMSLRLLDLAHNRISSMCDELFSFKNLRDLSLAGNLLVEVPAKIGEMRCLQQLWLHGNALEELPKELGELENLAILELHHNRLRSLPLGALSRLRKLNWLFAHGNQLSDGPGLVGTLAQLPRLKICGLGANQLDLSQVDTRGLRASFGLGWNKGLDPNDGVLGEQLTTCDLFWDRMSKDDAELPDILILTFSSQGAPIAQGQAEVRALRDALIKVDALYVCDPANAWYLQDPEDFAWNGLQYFENKIAPITSKYKRVFSWGGSMGGSAALLFSHLSHSVHAFSPQVNLGFTWPSFASERVREMFRDQVQRSIEQCPGTVSVHIGEENHNDNRHAAALPNNVRLHRHDTANHNTMKHVKQREKLLPLLKFEILTLQTELQAH